MGKKDRDKRDTGGDSADDEWMTQLSEQIKSLSSKNKKTNQQINDFN
jgi:hypothetical protein